MHPRTSEVIAALEGAQQEMVAFLDALPAGREHDTPADGGWSVAQVVEHLAIIEDSSGRLIGGMLKQLEGTTDPDTDPVTPTLARFQIANVVTRIEAPDMVQPRGAMDYAALRAKQAEARQRLIEALRAGAGRNLAAATFSHPLLGPLNGYQWALFTAQHQQRHLVQMRNLVAAR